MNTFKRLLTLYRKNGASRVPTEDYCTECLAGLLECDQELLSGFVNEVLNISSEEQFKVFTQKTYILDGEMIRVDLVFESPSQICFLEMKVHSAEGEQQLERYHRYLLHERKHQDKSVTLRYCTLYMERKESFETDVMFEQFRWADIAGFLSNYTESNQLIDEFYQFLKEKKMAGNERFTYQDLLGLQVYGELTSKVEEVFQLIEPELKARFGKTGGGVSATSQVTSKDRLAIWCEGVLGNSGWSEVLISFQFTGSRNTDGPQLVVQLWISKNNDSYSDLRKAVDKLEEYSFTDDIEYNGGRLRYDKPLAEFIESENQINEITTWITNRLEDLHQLKEKTSNLNWNTA